MVLYLRKAIKNKIAEKKITKEIAIDILKFYIDLILTSNLSDVCLQNTSASIQDLLNFKTVSDNKLIVHDLVVFLVSFTEKLDQNAILLYRSIVSVMEQIALSSSVHQNNVNDIFGLLYKNCEFMLNNLFSVLKSLQIENNPSNFLTIMDLTKLIFNFLHQSVLKLRSRLNVLGKYIDILNNKFMIPAIQMILMNVPGTQQIIAWQGDTNFDTSINSMKTKTLQFINSIITSYKSKLADENLVKTFSSLITISIQNLDWVVLNKFNYLQSMDKESLDFPDYGYENFIYQILQFINKIIIKEPFMDNFTSISKQFATGILIPLLVATKNELEQMKEEGEKYAHYINDVIEEHKSKTIKTMSSFVIISMCDKFDGLGTYLITYMAQLVDYVVKGSDNNNLANYNLLNANDRILNFSNSEYQIETSLLLFCILQEPIFKSPNLINNLFELHMNALFSADSAIIKDRLCLFIGTFLDTFYQPDNNNFALCVEFLFVNLFYYKENQGVAHKAADSLNEIVSIKKFSDSLKDLLARYFPKLIENIPTIKIGLYFDVLLEIVLNIDVEVFLIDLMSQLTNRVLQEIIPHTRIKFKVTSEKSNSNSNGNQYNIIVNKCLNIIRSVTDKADYVKKYINHFEKILDPLFDYMKNPSRIDFDEDIVLILTAFIKHLKMIPPSALKVLPDLPKYMKKSKGLLLDLYELINQFIVYGNGVIDVNEDYNKIIMKIFRASFDKKCDYDKSPFLGASIMQIWLQNSALIPHAIVKEVISIAIAQLNQL